MSTTLSFGRRASVSLDVPPESLVAEFAGPTQPPLADVHQATHDALAEPLGLPPLHEMLVPGDRVALVVEPDLPQRDVIVSTVVQTLMRAGVTPDNISLLQTQPSAARVSPRTVDPQGGWSQRLDRIIHNPRDRTALSYLAASRRDTPIYLNRMLCEADMVIPIGTSRLEESLAYWGVAGQLFPRFSDVSQRRRFQMAHADGSERQRRRRCAEADEVLWLLGVVFTLQVVPAGNDQVLAVLAGQVERVEEAGRTLSNQAWRFPVPQSVTLAVAAISGRRSQQTWKNLARTIDRLLPAVDDGGVIALCTELDRPPGPALQKMSSAESPFEARRALVRQASADAVAAMQLLKALDRVRVYLLSRLDEETVEDLGLTYIAEPSELCNLVRRHPRCLLVGNAQHAGPIMSNGNSSD